MLQNPCCSFAFFGLPLGKRQNTLARGIRFTPAALMCLSVCQDLTRNALKLCRVLKLLLHDWDCTGVSGNSCFLSCSRNQLGFVTVLRDATEQMFLCSVQSLSFNGVTLKYTSVPSNLNLLERYLRYLLLKYELIRYSV